MIDFDFSAVVPAVSVVAEKKSYTYTIPFAVILSRIIFFPMQFVDVEIAQKIFVQQLFLVTCIYVFLCEGNDKRSVPFRILFLG